MVREIKAKVTLDEHDKTLRISKNGVSDVIIRLDGGTVSVVSRAFDGMKSGHDDYCLLRAYGIGDSEKF